MKPIYKKREFIVLGVLSQCYTTLTGIKKETHEFKRLGSFNSLDSAVSFIMSRADGRFRVVRRAGKRFLPTLTCVKNGNILTF